MDSGNSGSMQSSSGGDDEYDSRSESISSFLNSSAHFASISDPQQPVPQHLLAHQPSTLFNPHSQNLDAFPQSLLANQSGNTAQFSNDLVWSRGLRSEANYANFGNVTGSSSASSSSPSVLGVQGLNTQFSFPASSSSSMPPQNLEANAAKASLQSDQPNLVKNPKKRTRASRRAPTTVLTTDTTNFRQMVQEFTGIPTAPFSAGSPYSRRLDLFSPGSSHMRSAGNLDSLGPLYPLRPSAQKVQLSPFVQSSSSSSLFTSSMIGTTASNAVLPSDLGMPKQPQDLLNMQNQMFSFQPLLQPSSLNLSPKHPSSVLGAKSQANTANTVPSLFDELGLGHHENVNANLSGFPTSLNGGQENLGGSGPDHQHHLSSFKFNCSGSTSDFHHDKGLENVTSGGEGTVGSWINRPSD